MEVQRTAPCDTFNWGFVQNMEVPTGKLGPREHCGAFCRGTRLLNCWGTNYRRSECPLLSRTNLHATRRWAWEGLPQIDCPRAERGGAYAALRRAKIR